MDKCKLTRKIQMEYVERVMEQIVETNQIYETVLNPLIELAKEELLPWEGLKHIISRIYLDMLRKDSLSVF